MIGLHVFLNLSPFEIFEHRCTQGPFLLFFISIIASASAPFAHREILTCTVFPLIPDHTDADVAFRVAFRL